MVKKEQVITINLPFGEGENREAQGMVAGGTGVMSCCLGQPVRQLPALLHCVQCEDPPWSLSSTAVPGWMGTGRAPPLGSCLV